MSGFESTHPRFLRPIDVARIRRNQNRIQIQRALGMARNLLVSALLLTGVFWLVQRTQSDARFAIRAVEIDGAVRTAREDVQEIIRPYYGTNLFRLRIEQVSADLRALPWVSRIELEKKLPDTLRVRIVERKPVALLWQDKQFRYLDESGRPFASLTPRAGDPELPVVLDVTSPGELTRTVRMLSELATRDPLVYSRVSEVRPVAPSGFAFFDRDLQTVVLAEPGDISRKWRTLYALAGREGWQRGDIHYADLRFAERIVVKDRIN